MSCRRIAGLAVLLAAAVSCSGDDVQEQPALDTGAESSSESFGMCEPDAEIPCQCADGRTGTQICEPSGFELSECDCGEVDPPTLDPTDPLPDPDPSSSSSGTGTDTDTGTGSDSGSSTGTT